ncbi:hypothetical protein SOPEG_3065 [Candidatus Sodalis pierantonius str. SOPE]|uniref:Probable membrane transporter protein n=1 Tax=Candidatus Sodalis pierantonii str. SOPE TaxID=2342 RepID=W0HQQ4_9GAMM|nr:sulfite exporter TauE/SafE family protein [Candidatus Sodalis pierantonius]AHF74535.1 hypothetical protein SOPEG_3065 [Candidatus Sodalis pierantonius str. SOPE]
MIVSELLCCLILGVGLGICGGMLGIGGDLIAIPVLSLLFHMDQLLAQGTALIMVTPNVLIGFLLYRQRNHIDLRQTFKLCLFATVSAWFAAQMASAMPVDGLQKAFAAFLLLLAAYYLWQWFDSHRHPVAAAVLSARFLPLLGIASGFMSGIFTVGGGLVVVPALVSLFGFSQTQAQGIALALVVPGALAALFSYALAGNADWSIGLPLALGDIGSVSWDVALAHKLPVMWLKFAFCMVLIGVAIAMLAA